ncbi:MAG: class I SAM-dependent methyltransferase [Terriglobia bacterium]
MSSSVRSGLREHHGDYGLDGGRTAVAGLVAMGATGLVLACFALIHARSDHIVLAIFELLSGLLLLQTIPSYLYSTRRGKFAVWAELLDGLPLRGDEHGLDMGCGRGAILSMLAKMLPRGRAVGLDLWRSGDQSGNSPDATWRNLDAECVRNRCELVTADMRAVPFADSKFDLVVSSLTIHNIKGDQGRGQAVDEAVRVLKPGGRLLIADLMWTTAYAKRLRELGMENVVEQQLDWPFWYGALGMVTGLVTATKQTDL